MNTPDYMPQLGRGSWKRGAGYACVNNYISYLEGDEVITDRPKSVHPLLHFAALRVNDTTCFEGGDCEGPTRVPFTGTPLHAHGAYREALCSECSGEIFRLIPRLLGTADVELSSNARRELELLSMFARKVFTPPPDVVVIDSPRTMYRYHRDILDRMLAIFEAQKTTLSPKELPDLVTRQRILAEIGQ